MKRVNSAFGTATHFEDFTFKTDPKMHSFLCQHEKIEIIRRPNLGSSGSMISTSGLKKNMKSRTFWTILDPQ